MEELKRDFGKDRYRQQPFLYVFLFQEYIYALGYDCGLMVFSFGESAKLLGYDNKSSFVLVKRLIIRMYRQNYLIYSFHDSNKNRFVDGINHFFSQSKMILSLFGVVLKMFQGSLLEEKKKKIPKYHNFRSIHSTFPFLEDKFVHLYYVSYLVIPYPIHLEVLIPILQFCIKDVSSLHFLRFFCYEYHNWNSFIPLNKSISIFNKNQSLFQLLYNYYVFEYESIFSFLREHSSYLLSTYSRDFMERTHLYGRIEHLGIVCRNHFQKNLQWFKDPCMHYIRSEENGILASKGTYALMKKWKWYLVHFWQCHFDFWSEPDRIHINQLYKNPFVFCGYLSGVLMNPLAVRSQMLEYSFRIDTVTKKLDTIVPVIAVMESLSKVQFCDVSGHPISKPIWTDLSDSDIIDKFARICRTCSHYCSGSSKKQSLYRMKYILRLSCAKTLARKHKTTVRTLLQRLGSGFLEEFFTDTEEEKVLYFVLPKISFLSHKSYRERIWYLDIIRINDFLIRISDFLSDVNDQLIRIKKLKNHS